MARSSDDPPKKRARRRTLGDSRATPGSEKTAPRANPLAEVAPDSRTRIDLRPPISAPAPSAPAVAQWDEHTVTDVIAPAHLRQRDPDSTDPGARVDAERPSTEELSNEELIDDDEPSIGEPTAFAPHVSEMLAKESEEENAEDAPAPDAPPESGDASSTLVPTNTAQLRYAQVIARSADPNATIVPGTREAPTALPPSAALDDADMRELREAGDVHVPPSEVELADDDLEEHGDAFAAEEPDAKAPVTDSENPEVMDVSSLAESVYELPDDGSATMFSGAPATVASPSEQTETERGTGSAPELTFDDETTASADRTRIETRAPAGAVAPQLAQVPIPPYKPPALANADERARPAHRVDADEKEELLTKEKRWDTIIDLYLARIQDAPSWQAKARLFMRVSSVFEYELDDNEQAFDAALEAFKLAPADEDVLSALERLGLAVNQPNVPFDRAKGKIAQPMPGTRVALLGALVRWSETLMKRPELATTWFRELEAADRLHPLVQRRVARAAQQAGDARAEKEALERAVDRVDRRADKVALYLSLAQVRGTKTEEALKVYETAYSIAPTSFDVLSGLERTGAALERFGQVAWALERQIENAPAPDHKIAALLRLAELYEKRFVRRDGAAKFLEEVLRIAPTHEVALAGLERCYHAARAWPELGRTMRRRADAMKDPRARAEQLARVAEVLDLKAGDPAGALEVLKQAHVLDEKSERLLTGLARLAEKCEAWSDVALYKGKLAQRMTNKRAASLLYVQLGDLLSPEDRDPIAARMQYEKAVEVDRENAAAWEALEKVARTAGDDRRVAQCLEERAKYTESARVKAQLLTDLAKLKRALGDERGALAANEAAFRADATNELAAEALVDGLVAASKWKEAAAACDVLAAAARREKDTPRLQRRLRQAAHVAASQGQIERALDLATEAWECDESDPQARADLVDLCTRAKDKPSAVAKVTAALSKLARDPTGLDADALARLGRLELTAGKLDAAIATFARAIASDPANVPATEGMAEACIAKEDWAGACDCKVALARNSTNAEDKFARLCEAGDLWAHRARDFSEAQKVWEEAARMKPRDHWILHSLMWLFGEMELWERLVEVLFAIGEIQENPERRAKSLYAAGKVVAEKVGDLLRAAEIFDRVLDVDPKRLDAFEQIVRVLTARRDWQELETAYKRMIARAKGGDASLRFALVQQLGLVYRDRLGEPELALEALGAAEQLRPNDAELRKMMTELEVVTDKIENAVARIRVNLRKNPHDPDLYAELYDLFLRQHAFDKAWCTVNVLGELRELTQEQARFYTDYPPRALGDIPGQLTPEAWASHVIHSALDPVLTRLLALMTPAVARMRHAQLGPAELVRMVGRPFTQKHSNMADAIRRTFHDAAEILAIPIPELLAAAEPVTAPLAPALSPYGAIYVSGPLVEARADALVFLIGKRLAEQRPELCARAFFPSTSDLTTLLGAAVRVAKGAGARDPASQSYDAALVRVMTWDEQQGVRAIVDQATREGALLDVKRWSQLADLSSSRAGLVLAGDVAGARRAIAKEPQSPADLSPRDKTGELYLFATSDEYADLRGAIGVAVSEGQ